MKLFVQQPYFLPWLGYFAKILHADTVVFLSDVNFRRSHIGRAKYLNEFGAQKWLTLPLGASQNAVISKIQIPSERDFTDGFERRVFHSYRPAAHFQKEMIFFKGLMDEVRSFSGGDLGELNKILIEHICRYLGIHDKHFLMQHEVSRHAPSKNSIVDVFHAVEASTLITGDGGSLSLMDMNFRSDLASDIVVVPYSRNHPTYVQSNNTGGFVAGLTIFDALFNIGRDEVVKLVGACQPISFSEFKS